MTATLFMVCGPICAGKSTLMRQKAEAGQCVYLSEDAWIAGLFPGEVVDVPSLMDRTRRLRSLIGPHVVALLNAGTSVALDFQANTIKSREWMRGLVEASGAAHELHWLDVPAEVCKARLRERNAAGTHEFAPTEEDFDLIACYFQPPTEAEGLRVLRGPV